MKPHIEILPDNDALARHIANKILQQARESIAARGRFTFVLTGGDSPVPLYETFAKDPAYRNFPWDKTLCFFGDDRHVPPNHRTSNYHQAKIKLFDSKLIPEKNIFRFESEIPDAEEVAANYEKCLRDHFPSEAQLNGFPRFDVVLLGLGANGHTASIFPCTPALHERKLWAMANPVPELDKYRLTLTLPAINAARHIYLEAIDPRKRDIITYVLRAEELNFYPFPIQRIAPVSGDYYWFLTEATAPPRPKA